MSSATVDEEHSRIIMLVKAGLHDEAIARCERNIREWDVPLRHEAWHHLGYVLWRRGSKAEALEAMSEAVKLEPDHRGHRFFRASWSLSEGDLEISLADWSKIIEIEEALGSQAFLCSALMGRALVLMLLRRSIEAELDLCRVSDDEVLFVADGLWDTAAIRSVANRKRS